MTKDQTEHANYLLMDLMNKPPEAIAEDVADTYPGIALKDALRIREGLLKVLTASTRAELYRRGKEYEKLQKELTRKYRKSGGH